MSVSFTLVDAAFYAFQFVHGLCTAILTATVMRIVRTPAKRDVRIAQLESDIADLVLRIQKLQGRMGRQIREEREAEREEGEAQTDFTQRKGETAAEWKLRTRALIQRGVKP